MRNRAIRHLALASLAGLSAPAMAADPRAVPAPASVTPPATTGDPALQTVQAHEVQREAWLSECRRRIGATPAIGGTLPPASDAGSAPAPAQDTCAAMLQPYFVPGFGVSSLPLAGGSAPVYTMAPGYAGPVMMVPVMLIPQPRPDCKKTETVEYVTTWEPVRRRHIPARSKRIRMD